MSELRDSPKEVATSILWRAYNTGLEYFFTQWTTPQQLEEHAKKAGLDPTIMHRILVAARTYLEARRFLWDSLEKLRDNYDIDEEDIEG